MLNLDKVTSNTYISYKEGELYDYKRYIYKREYNINS